MLRVVFHDRIDSLSPDLVRRVNAFLATFLAEGTVRMSPAAYRGATMWALALDDDEIVGFAAQRLCDDGDAAIVQVMGTFLAPRLRGSLMASTLLQGKIFFKTWMRAPFRPIFWCTRTRIPAVYRTATLFNEIYPKFDDPFRNRAVWPRAVRIAHLVYGEHTSLEPDTFVLRNSYAPDSAFLPLRHKRSTPVHDAFARVLDYDENEAIFIFCRLDQRNILRYILASAAFRVSSRWRDDRSPRPLLTSIVRRLFPARRRAAR